MTAPVAVISGGAQGIGAATAQRLTKNGWQVALLDLNAEGARAQAEQLGPDNLGLGCDVSNSTAVQDAIAQVGSHFGRIDAVISAAGNITRAPAEEFDLGVWQKHLDIHLTGTFLLAQACHSLLAESKGSIVTFASVASTFGLPGRVAYGTVKTGMVGLTRTLAAGSTPSLLVTSTQRWSGQASGQDPSMKMPSYRALRCVVWPRLKTSPVLSISSFPPQRALSPVFYCRSTAA